MKRFGTQSRNSAASPTRSNGRCSRRSGVGIAATSRASHCLGLPTVGGEVEFDTSFERNCLVDVVCLGLGLRDKLVPGGSIRPGYLVYVVGGSTGGDGIQGASFASRTLTERSDSERSAVQVPDPFTKKLIIEAVL